MTSEENAALQVCGTFKILQLSCAHDFSMCSRRIRNKTLQCPCHTVKPCVTGCTDSELMHIVIISSTVVYFWFIIKLFTLIILYIEVLRALDDIFSLLILSNQQSKSPKILSLHLNKSKYWQKQKIITFAREYCQYCIPITLVKAWKCLDNFWVECLEIYQTDMI